MNAQLDTITREAINPALAMLPPRMDSPEARVLLLAITLQEDPEMRRRQWPIGPARGLWQFEQGGGVRGVCRHPASKHHAERVCAERGVPFVLPTIWSQLEFDDVLAAAFARLLLWTDPGPLPSMSARDRAWVLYAQVLWRPGKPHPSKWPRNHRAAVEFVIQTEV